MRRVIFGPPGTGKTYTLMQLIVDMLHRGAEPADIAFLSFSRAALDEARARVEKSTGLPQTEFRWFRTMHSTWTRVQGIQKSELFDATAAKEFAGMYKCNLTVNQIMGTVKKSTEFDDDVDMEWDNPLGRKANTLHDQYRNLYDLSRLAMVPLEHVERFLPRDGNFFELQDFVRKFEAYKSAAMKQDFTDIIMGAYRSKVIHPCPYLIVDEAQDLAPLMIATLAPTIAGAAEAYVAGDDDQAIFAFQGASPRWLMSLTRDPEWDTTVLPKSYRCPEPVRRAAAVIAQRIQERVPKSYTAREGGGLYAVRVPSADAIEMAVAADSAFFLARTNMFAGFMARSLYDAGIPYRLERGKSKETPDPMREGGLTDAIATLAALGRGEAIGPRSLGKALDLVPHDEKKAGSAVYGWLERGVKTKVKKHSKPVITREDWPALKLEAIAAACAVDFWAPLAPKCETPGELRWLRRLWDANGGAWPEITVTVGTWHWSKGQEAEVIVIEPGLVRPCARALASSDHTESDTEHRCAYVALTRAKRVALVLRAHPKSYGSYPFPEPQP